MAGLLDSIITDLTGIGTGADLTDGLGDAASNFGFSFGGGGSGVFDDIPEIKGDAEDLTGGVGGAGEGMAVQAGVQANPAPAPQAAAQAPNWQQQAAAPPMNWQQRQQQNAQLINGHQASTSRYYNRQLYREIVNDKRASPESKIEARAALRFNGAPSNAQDYVGNRDTMSTGGDSAGPNAANWGDLFNSTRSNNFAGSKGQFDPATGTMQPKPIAQKAQNTQSVLDGIMRMTGQILTPRAV